MESNRRDFIKTLGLGSLLALRPFSTQATWQESTVKYKDELSILSFDLLKQWCDELLKYQVTDKKLGQLYGGLLCPACNRVHGRCADAIYPLMHMSTATGDNKYLLAAKRLYQWMETNVSLPNGAWVNDVNVSPWIGTTVFTAITLCESLTHHSHLFDKGTQQTWKKRLNAAADFIHQKFHINFSNVNYPISAAYALTIIGDLLNNEAYKKHGQQLAKKSLLFFTPNEHFLYGEGGKNRGKISPKGLHPVDLGYNVEESLPALAFYGLHTNDEEVLEKVEKSMQTHAELMLPDGGWDNSWGTRNFKWTYWGSRTSDGCQAAYALLANRNPLFYQVALRNTQLMKKCSENGLLKAGLPPYHDQQPACIHHTFTHAKALATLLDNNQYVNVPTQKDLKLPREINYGSKELKDIGTWLYSDRSWVATITAYDFDYTFKNGHPTGGALSMLCHRQLGPVLSASMNHYHLQEPPNMQFNKDPNLMPLTPRVQTADGKYMNISDQSAQITHITDKNEIRFEIKAHLVDGEQKHPTERPIQCHIVYLFKNNEIKILVEHDANTSKNIQLIVPVISASTEKYEHRHPSLLTVYKPKGQLTIESKQDIQVLKSPENTYRFFNHVPGLEAIPLAITGQQMQMTISAKI